MSTETAIITQDPAFGELVNLPNILNQNKTSALNCVTACRSVIDTVKELKLTELTPDQIKMHSDKVAQFRSKATTTLEAMNARRAPHTKFMDGVKSLFTAEEKHVQCMIDELKYFDDNMQRAIASFNAKEQEKQAAQIAKNTEAITIRTNIAANVMNNVRQYAATLTKRMMDKFYSFTEVSKLYEFRETMEKYVPAIDEATWNSLCKNGDATYRHHTPDEVANLYGIECINIRDEYAAIAIKIVTECKTNILNNIESRAKELVRIGLEGETAAKEAAERIRLETLARETAQAQAAFEATAQLATQAEADKTNVVFETMAEAAPVHSIASGTVVKKKYNATTHAAWMAIMQSWITNEMPALSMDELETKLKFMLTAANKRLNNGEVLQAKGLEVETDFSTRAKRTA